jgi:hypothetical protein
MLRPLVLIVLALVGCQSSAPGGAPPEVVPDAPVEELALRGLPSAGGRFYIEWAPVPDPIPLNRSFEVEVRVSDPATREPLTDIEVVVDAGMPFHNHGMNRKPRVEARGDGSFRARGMLFHMPGEWELYVDVFQRGISERARIPLEVD